MNLNCETILDFYEHNNKKVLCLIKVVPKSGKLQNSCRCLSQKNWKTFDDELEKLITVEDDWNNDKYIEFDVKSNIRVRVQKSKISMKAFYKCLGVNDVIENKKDVVETNFVLECLFDFQLEVPFTCSAESQEYDPHIEASPYDISTSPLSYIPYTPSKKKYKMNEIDTVKTPGIDFLECNENTYSPEPISEIVTNGSLLTETTPKCNRSTIKGPRSSSDSDISNDSDVLNKAIIDSRKKATSRLKQIRISREKNRCNRNDHHNTDKHDKGKFLEIKSNENFKEHCAVAEIRQQKVSQKDNLKKFKERSKSEDLLLEPNDKTIKHIPKEKKPTTGEKHSEFGIKVKKKRSRTLDEIPADISSDMVEICTKLVEIPSHNTKEEMNYKVCSSKEKMPLSGKNPERSCSGDKYSEKFPKIMHELEKTPAGDRINPTHTSPQKMIRGERKSRFSSKETTTSLRRSERSPRKTKQLLEKQPDPLIKIKSKNKSVKNKKVFVTDNDEDDFFESNKGEDVYYDNKIKPSILVTPSNKKFPTCLSSSSSTTKKKRKRDKSHECQQEKRDISKWLSKKKSIISSQETTKSSKVRTKLSSSKPLPIKTSIKIKSKKIDVDSENRPQPAMPPTITMELPSKEEMELIRSKSKIMQKENARVKAELDKMCTSPPKEVQILSLQNIPVSDILSTFLTYKHELDEIYENNCKRDHIKGHDGINHCFVIRLLKPNIQMKMLEKLTEVYNNSKTSTQATLFANALLPEWVIRVYMDKFNFTRQEAIDQIKAQEEFQLHMEEQNDNTFIFD